jgi:DNA-binding HxlR family transcriptional regulator
VHSYGQYCALAKALDVLGGRWTLLIVRELLIRPCRYTDLRNGLPGIATNMLAERLRELKDAGVIESEEAPPPVATTVFRLTPWGRELEAVLKLLGSWGAPLLAQAGKGDRFCPHWLVLPIGLYLQDCAPEGPPVCIELRTGDEPLTVEIAQGRVQARPGAAKNPDLVLTGSPQATMGLLFGQLDWKAAQRAGLKSDGDLGALRRIRSDTR